jgi:SAM-dependent methyltransferase
MSSIDPRESSALQLFRKSVLKQAKYKALLRYAGDTSGKDCLDLGSDNGVISYLLRQRGGRWTSADLTDKSVDSIRGLVGTNVERIDGVTMPFADGFFDLVIVIDLLEHVADDRRCLAELSRILRPGGDLILNTPHAMPRSLMRKVRDRLGLTDEWHGHLRPGYTLDGLRRLLAADFVIAETRTYSKVFSELLDVALNYAYLRKSGDGGGDRAKGTVVTGEDLAGRQRELRLLSIAYPALWMFAKLDALLFPLRGYYLIVKARKRA